jgi:hypothetical protein
LSIALKKTGLELMDDKKSILVEKITSVIGVLSHRCCSKKDKINKVKD